MVEMLTQYANHAQELITPRGMEWPCVMRKMAPMRGNRLKEIRNARGWGQETVAERADFSVAQISRWESGKDAIPSTRLARLAAAYECGIGEIFEKPMVLSEGEIAAMLELAQRELPTNSTFGDWPHSVASALHAQIARLRDDWSRAQRTAIANTLDEDAQSPQPTRPNVPA